MQKYLEEKTSTDELERRTLHQDLKESKCENFRGITLHSYQQMFLTVLVKQMKDSVDTKLRDQNVSSRDDQSCKDSIVTLRVIVEQ